MTLGSTSATRHKWYIGVLGQHAPEEPILSFAYEIGRAIAKRGGILLCGGLGGVMEAACRGAKEAGGVTIGILPGYSPNDANPFVDFAIATGLGEARNFVLVTASSALIACGGQAGTLSEIALALRLGKVLAGVYTWTITDHRGRKDFFPSFSDPEEAVEYVFAELQGTLR
ncbi:MAG: TIGR00725 family protein [Candidatus Caldatribacterium sp.]|uniref:TIGR00725 family protein n=1 Tax=Candidatus Caldatribacterium sp. TaxID=2282143 RepID=UPI002990C836|nr:TIGR00725 family protein [Candidatus Caldatribacterium sp.]MCX7729737.1 TIGR00725 family protein [Candidatus Caldatribacterium sp.]MDW8081159.1 TIGR00725 family protein [Candidatus Calescibacterium sp.]